MNLFKAPTFDNLLTSSEDVQHYLTTETEEVPADIEEAILDAFNDLRFTTQNYKLKLGSINPHNEQGSRYHLIPKPSFNDDFVAVAVPKPLIVRRWQIASPVQFNTSRRSSTQSMKSLSMRSGKSHRSFNGKYDWKKSDSVLDPDSPTPKRLSYTSTSPSPLRYRFDFSSDSDEAPPITPTRNSKRTGTCSLAVQTSNPYIESDLESKRSLSKVYVSTIEPEDEVVSPKSRTNEHSSAIADRQQFLADSHAEHFPSAMSDSQQYLADCRTPFKNRHSADSTYGDEVFIEAISGTSIREHSATDALTMNYSQGPERFVHFHFTGDSHEDIQPIFSVHGSPRSVSKPFTQVNYSAPNLADTRRHKLYHSATLALCQQRLVPSNTNMALAVTSPQGLKRSGSLFQRAGAVSNQCCSVLLTAAIKF